MRRTLRGGVSLVTRGRELIRIDGRKWSGVLTHLSPHYEWGVREFLRDLIPEAIVLRPVTYNVPGVWYFHARVPEDGTKTVRLVQAVVEEIPLQSTLDALRGVHGWLRRPGFPTVLIDRGARGVELRLERAG